MIKFIVSDSSSDARLGATAVAAAVVRGSVESEVVFTICCSCSSEYGPFYSRFSEDLVMSLSYFLLCNEPIFNVSMKHLNNNLKSYCYKGIKFLLPLLESIGIMTRDGFNEIFV